MLQLIKRILRIRGPENGTICLMRGETDSGNWNSYMRFNGNTWSMTPAGPRRKRTRGDVAQAHKELAHAMKRGVILFVKDPE